MAEARVDRAFSILGRPLRAEGLPAPIAAWLDARWRFEHPGLEAPPDDTAFEILLEMIDAPGGARLGAGEPHVARLDGMELAWRTLDGEWMTGTPRCGVRFSRCPGGSRVSLWLADGVDASGLHAPLYVALSESLRASGLLPLHAAVAVRDGSATAFLGRSGVGKTTTLIRALAAGWTPVAEDLAWIDDTSMTLHGFDRGIRLAEDARLALGDALPEEGWRRDPDGKLYLQYSALTGGIPIDAEASAEARCGADPSGATRSGARLPSAPSAHWTRLALLERNREGARDTSRWTPLEPADAVRAVWEAVGVPLTPEARAVSVRRVPELLRRLDFARLNLGRPPLPL